jgi:hypothetical protein
MGEIPDRAARRVREVLETARGWQLKEAEWPVVADSLGLLEQALAAGDVGAVHRVLDDIESFDPGLRITRGIPIPRDAPLDASTPANRPRAAPDSISQGMIGGILNRLVHASDPGDGREGAGPG